MVKIYKRGEAIVLERNGVKLDYTNSSNILFSITDSHLGIKRVDGLNIQAPIPFSMYENQAGQPLGANKAEILNSLENII